MLGERIWGKQFIKELNEPHSDPEIRKFEERMAKYQLEYFARIFRKPTFEEVYDVLPQKYKDIKL